MSSSSEIKKFVNECGKDGYTFEQVIDSLKIKYNFLKIDFSDMELVDEYIDGKSEFEYVMTCALSGV